MGPARGAAVAGVLLAILGGLAAAVTQDTHSVCSSSVGALGQVASHRVTVGCFWVGGVWLLGLVAVGIGAVLLGAAAIIAATRNRSGTPAGWYADPWAPGHERWWDGSAWTPHQRPR